MQLKTIVRIRKKLERYFCLPDYHVKNIEELTLFLNFNYYTTKFLLETKTAVDRWARRQTSGTKTYQKISVMAWLSKYSVKKIKGKEKAT